MSRDLQAVYDQLIEINLTLCKHGEQLAEHIRRTALLEAAIVPLLKAKNWVEFSFTIVGSISTLLAVVTAVLSALKII